MNANWSDVYESANTSYTWLILIIQVVLGNMLNCFYVLVFTCALGNVTFYGVWLHALSREFPYCERGKPLSLA